VTPQVGPYYCVGAHQEPEDDLQCPRELYRYKVLSHYTRKSLRGYILEEKVSEFLGTFF
jgi:hypothetical protein